MEGSWEVSVVKREVEAGVSLVLCLCLNPGVLKVGGEEEISPPSFPPVIRGEISSPTTHLSINMPWRTQKNREC